MMSNREPVDEVLNKKDLTADQRQKIILSQKARIYAFEKLKLKETKNYSTYIDLKRPYVTWVVQAAYKWEIKNYEWSYLFLGKMPYKGFFNEADAKAEAEILNQQGFDTYVRGVSAYSTLGYLQDSLLSSMLRYKEHDLVNTIIHELVHTTIYIKNNSDFNERLAVFIGAKGTEMFYKDLEGENSKMLETIKNDNEDEFLFGQFISQEINLVKDWYKNNSQSNDEQRQIRLNEILNSFNTKLKPKLKTNSYSRFTNEKMNNARLGMFKTYMENLDEFDKIYEKYDKNLLRFIEAVKTLESSKDPTKDLKML